MITDTCCYYYSGDLGLSPLIQHGALHLDRFFFGLFCTILISPFSTFQKWQISACGGILVNGATNLCIGESY